jgi:hypothetical protein
MIAGAVLARLNQLMVRRSTLSAILVREIVLELPGYERLSNYLDAGPEFLITEGFKRSRSIGAKQHCTGCVAEAFLPFRGRV